MNKLLKNIQSSVSPFTDSKLLVAVSGGIDSLVLLHALKVLGYDPIALHINYNLRGEESKNDEEFIRELCSSKGIELKVNKIHLNEILDKEGGNLQNKARIERYNWFKKIAEQFDKYVVLLGHHQDDQIETFLLQLFRGAGLRGLSAMSKSRDIFIRPLLDVNRSEILEFARENNILWREDSSNSSLKYSRNKLRNEFIPFMEKEVPTIKKDILTLVDVIQQNYRKTQNEVEKIAKRVAQSDTFSIEDLKTWEDEFLIELLRQLKIPTQIHTELRKLTSSDNNKSIAIEHELYVKIVKRVDHLQLMRNSSLLIPELIIERVQGIPEEFDKDHIYLDENKLFGPLKLRKWKEGDKIASIGIKGTQLVSKILHDAKVPITERENYFVLSDDVQIHWCPKYKVGRNAIASLSSDHIIKCSITYKGYV